jgi:O-antigen/teichoic acid export membrane protein
MTMGIMYVAHYFYDETELGLFYIALKLYMIYQGVKRLIVQSFFRDMIDARVALKVDQLAILSGLPIFIATGLFSASFIMNVYDAAYLGADVHFILLGFAIVVQSVGTSASISILLSEDDNRLTFNLIVSALLTIGSCIVFSFFSDIRGYGISLSILIGESVLFLLNARTVKVDNYLGKRLRFMITPSLMLLVPVAVRCFGGDTFPGLLLSLALFGAAAALKYFRYFQSE